MIEGQLENFNSKVFKRKVSMSGVETVYDAHKFDENLILEKKISQLNFHNT